MVVELPGGGRCQWRSLFQDEKCSQELPSTALASTGAERRWVVKMKLFGCLVLLLSGSAFAIYQTMAVSGEELAWRVENEHFIADFSPNPKTGRSGQLNTIYLKAVDLLLTRGTESSTFHLSPNVATGGPWRGINRWDPPAHYEARQDEGWFEIERNGPMPLAPGLEVHCTYRVETNSPSIRVKEEIAAREDVRVTLLRLNEFSMVPGEENPFTHLVWMDAEGRLQVAEAESTPVLPFSTKGMGFYSQSKGTGFISVVDELIMEGPDGGAAILNQESAHYAGDPHYFYYALIYSPQTDSETGERPWITVKRGTRYEMTYDLIFFRGRGSEAETILEELDRYLRNKG